MKKCCHCKYERDFEEFSKCKTNKDGFQKVCKICQKKQREEKKEEINERKRKQYQKNKDKILERNRKYKERNKNYNKEYYRKNYEKERKRADEYKKKRYENDIEYRIMIKLRGHCRRALKKGKGYDKYLGCDIRFFKKWIEFQFEPWMNWNNYGIKWDIDHILPISIFKLKNNSHWINMQPLEKIENQKKSNKIELHYFMNSIINVNRFIQHKKSNFDGYQALRETLRWLREKN